MKRKLISLSLLFLIFIAACNKNKPDCYSRSVEKQNKNNSCLTDCPGVTGCDGKFYCNECEANKKGIKIK